MKKMLLTMMFAFGALYATDYANISTEELLEMRGSEPQEDRAQFREELQNRIKNMSQEERMELMEKYGRGQSRGNGQMQRMQGTMNSDSQQMYQNQQMMQQHQFGRGRR